MKFGNNLTEVQEEILGLLQEEAAEIIQELSKIRRTGMDFCRNGKDVPNHTFVRKELIDFLVILGIAAEAGMFTEEDFDADEYALQKIERLKQWTNLPHNLLS